MIDAGAPETLSRDRRRVTACKASQRADIDQDWAPIRRPDRGDLHVKF
jgi:hypothetical protein